MTNGSIEPTARLWATRTVDENASLRSSETAVVVLEARP